MSVLVFHRSTLPRYDFRLVLALSVITLGGGRMARGVVVSEYGFSASGGNLSQKDTTYERGYRDATTYGQRGNVFKPAGSITGADGQTASATWLGTDGAGHTWFLTSAQAVTETLGATSAGIAGGTAAWSVSSFGFNDSRGAALFSGLRAAAFTPSVYDGGHGGNVALVRVEGLWNLWRDGQEVERPALYAGNAELEGFVEFAGAGLWGVAETGWRADWSPSGGNRFAAGSQIVDRAAGGVLEFTMDRPGEEYFTLLEAGFAPGDEGAGWWQEHEGLSALVAVTSFITPEGARYGGVSTGTRLSDWTEWIRSVHPEARFAAPEPSIAWMSLAGANLLLLLLPRRRRPD